MKNDRYRNRKYIFQIMDRKTFKWYDVFTARDEEDMLEQLKPVCAYSEEYDQYRILKNNNGNEIVSDFLHGKKDIELFLDRMTKIIEQKEKKGSHLKECLETSLYYGYYQNGEGKKQSQERILDSIDREIIKFKKQKDQAEEDEIVEKVKELTLGNYIV